MQSDEQHYFVKKILDCKIDLDGQKYYKVKWEATWEPADSLVGSMDLIDDYWSFIDRGASLSINSADNRLLDSSIKTDKPGLQTDDVSSSSNNKDTETLASAVVDCRERFFFQMKISPL